MGKDKKYSIPGKIAILLFGIENENYEVTHQIDRALDAIVFRKDFDGLDRDTMNKYLVYFCAHSALLYNEASSYIVKTMIPLIIKLLDLGADINYDKGLVWYTALICSKRNTKIPKLLIKHGIKLDLDVKLFFEKSCYGTGIASIYGRDDGRSNNIHRSFRLKQIEDAETIMDIILYKEEGRKRFHLAKLFPELKCENPEKPFRRCINNCDAEGMLFILKYEPDFSRYIDDSKVNLLEYGIRKGNDICQILIDRNIEVTPTDSMMKIAIDHRYLDVLRYLIKKGGTIPNLSKGELLKLFDYGIYDVLKILLDNGLDPDSYESLMLITACKMGLDPMTFYSDRGESVIELLLKSGANVSLPVKALVDIVIRKGINVLKILLSHGLDPNIHNGLILITACEKGFGEIIMLLMEAGGDPSICNNSAIKLCHNIFEPNPIVALIESGADPNALNLPISNAIFRGNHIALKVLLDMGGKANRILMDSQKGITISNLSFHPDLDSESKVRIVDLLINHLREDDEELEISPSEKADLSI